MDLEHNNMGVQSTEYLTMSRIGFKSVYEKRVVYAIVESMSKYLKGIIDTNVKGKEINYQLGAFIDEVSYYAHSLEGNRQNYPLLRKALDRLKEESIKIETHNETINTSFVLKYKWQKGSEIIKLNVDRELFQLLANIVKGYTLIQMKTALTLSSLHSMKIYELLCSYRKKKKFYISLEELKFITNTLDKYPNTAHFKIRVLDTAKKELDNNPHTDLKFTYKDVKKGKRIVGFDIYVKKTNKSVEEQKLKKQISPLWDVPLSVANYLKNEKIELKGQSLDIVKKWVEKENGNENEMLHKLLKFKDRAERKIGVNPGNYAAFIMGCIKNEVKQ